MTTRTDTRFPDTTLFRSPGRAGGDEDSVGRAGEDVVDGGHRRADTGQRRFKALRPDIGIGLDLADLVFFRDLPQDGAQMLLRMGKQYGVLARLRRLSAVKFLEIRVLQCNRQRSQPVRPLRMPLWRPVFEENVMFVKAGRTGERRMR